MNRIADKKGNSFARLKSKNLAPKLKKLEKKYPDVILINEEFDCNDEIFLLPRDVARLDAEFLGVSHDDVDAFLWANPGLFFVYFQSFQTNINTIFTTNQCEKCQFLRVYGAGIRTHDLSIISHLP